MRIVILALVFSILFFMSGLCPESLQAEDFDGLEPVGLLFQDEEGNFYLENEETEELVLIKSVKSNRRETQSGFTVELYAEEMFFSVY